MHGRWTSEAAYFAHHEPKACSAHGYDKDKVHLGPGLEATGRAATCMFTSFNAMRTLGGILCKATFAVLTAGHSLDLRTE